MARMSIRGDIMVASHSSGFCHLQISKIKKLRTQSLANGYKTTSGKHEGIDIHYKIGAPIYALTDGVVVRVVYGKCGGHGLSTIAIYNKAANKTVVYLHSAPASGLKAGQTVRRGQRIGVESWRGITRSSGAHTHVEVRNGRVGYAAKSVNDYKLDNQNPASFWKGQGYTIN